VSTNKLLARLSRADAQLLEPHLSSIELPVRKQLQAANRRVDRIYFPESGIASIVSNGTNPIEVGMIGRDGMTGASVVLGNGDRVPHEVYMQVAGRGVHLPADRVREAIAKSVTLHQVLLSYAHDFLTQTTQTAMANGRGKIEDRVDGNELRLTHEFLAVMLGVRRSGITTALQELERKGLIVHRRSVINITDREGLEESSNGAYLPPYDNS
jgi:CRP-like cAMP-binding protein